MPEAGLRAKSRTHATSPAYERVRRSQATKQAHVEKQMDRRGRRKVASVDLLILFEAARRAMNPGGIFIHFRETK